MTCPERLDGVTPFPTPFGRSDGIDPDDPGIRAGSFQQIVWLAKELLLRCEQFPLCTLIHNRATRSSRWKMSSLGRLE
jgi:hypothetical protein